MKVLIVGSGGREHAIAWSVAKSPKVDKIYCAPGNAGISEYAECVAIGAMEFEKLADFAEENKVDLTIIGMDDPLVGGVVDVFEARGLKVFGPRKNAAILEGSKAFSKQLMKKYGIPTAAYEIFTDREAALAYLETVSFPTVIKADGLALGKGVIIAETLPEAQAAVNAMMLEGAFGKSGERIVIEQYLTGPEVSVLSFTDGKTIVPMVSSMDHKRALDGDRGLNTGGMGTVAPNPYYTGQIADICMETIFKPTVSAMNAEGRTFKGCLYFGLMLTPEGPRVIEYNCRFGDPETQVVLPLLESDLFTVMRAVTEERLSEVPVTFADRSAACVIMASDGYPAHYEKGFPITIPEDVLPYVYSAGTALKDGQLVTAGGRVLGVVAVADTLPDALKLAYKRVENIRFENAYYRHDIGRRACAHDMPVGEGK